MISQKRRALHRSLWHASARSSLNHGAWEMLSEEETANLPAARPGEMKTDPLLDAYVDPTLDERGPGREKYAARHTVCMEGRSTLSSLGGTESNGRPGS
jgi:hypothetical protein